MLQRTFLDQVGGLSAITWTGRVVGGVGIVGAGASAMTEHLGEQDRSDGFGLDWRRRNTATNQAMGFLDAALLADRPVVVAARLDRAALAGAELPALFSQLVAGRSDGSSTA